MWGHDVPAFGAVGLLENDKEKSTDRASPTRCSSLNFVAFWFCLFVVATPLFECPTLLSEAGSSQPLLCRPHRRPLRRKSRPNPFDPTLEARRPRRPRSRPCRVRYRTVAWLPPPQRRLRADRAVAARPGYPAPAATEHRASPYLPPGYLIFAPYSISIATISALPIQAAVPSG